MGLKVGCFFWCRTSNTGLVSKRRVRSISDEIYMGAIVVGRLSDHTFSYARCACKHCPIVRKHIIICTTGAKILFDCLISHHAHDQIPFDCFATHQHTHDTRANIIYIFCIGRVTLVRLKLYHAPHSHSNRKKIKHKYWVFCWDFLDWLSGVKGPKKIASPVDHSIKNTW